VLKRVFEGAECVFHQAAIPTVQRSVENPVAINEANVTGTLNVLQFRYRGGMKFSKRLHSASDS